MTSAIRTLLLMVMSVLFFWVALTPLGLIAHAAPEEPVPPTQPFVIGQRYDCIGTVGSQPWRATFTVDELIGNAWLAVSAVTQADAGDVQSQVMPTLRWVNIQHLMACGEPVQANVAITATTAITSASGAADQTNPVSFPTPEDAITAYMAGLTQQDPSQLLRACAIEEMSNHFDFAGYTERLQAMLLVTALAPAEYPFYVAINQQQLSAQLLNQAKNFSFALLSAEAVDGRTIPDVNPDRVTHFIQDVDPARLAALQVEQIGVPNPALLEGNRYQENAKKMAAVYGATESTERVVLFSFADEYYMLGFTLLRYGDTWKISSQTSPLSNTSALGTPTPTTVDDFESLTARE